MCSATELAGTCHCGGVEIEFQTRHPIGTIRIGRCDCSFCRRHGARTVSDPKGRATIREVRPGALRAYRFGLKTADFLLCAECGVYIAAVLEAEGRTVATLNVNQFDARDDFDPAPPLFSYDGESAEERRARRLARWTPAEVIHA